MMNSPDQLSALTSATAISNATASNATASNAAANNAVASTAAAGAPTAPTAPTAPSRRREQDVSVRVAHSILAGFDRHYALFRYNAQQAKRCFESANWLGIRKLARERIEYYDKRVVEAIVDLESHFEEKQLQDDIWQGVKRHYIGLLANHKQPELAETFFNSVSTKVLHRTYFHNDFIFVRPGVATDYLDAKPSSYRVYYPPTCAEISFKNSLKQLVIDIGFSCPFVDIDRDLGFLAKALIEVFDEEFQTAGDFQIQVLRGLFFRNKGGYIIGRIINDSEVTGIAIPVLMNDQGQLFLDTILLGSERIETLFNFSRAYFMIDMEVPSAYVRFLSTLMPAKPDSELYTMLGLHKQGKTLFYRDLLQHLNHSHDPFNLAPGIKGLVMLVFTLPSFPYVFKVIRDKRRKDMTREYIQGRYQLVKLHDRVGRMADTWEYSNVPFPIDRIHPDLMKELLDTAGSSFEIEGNTLVIKHLYIERRMIPLNIRIEQVAGDEKTRLMREYGDAIKQMVAANIFPGDMLYKNFGVTRTGRVVFYDYDEVQYLTDCNFRKIPEPRTPEDEMSSEPWYNIGPNDVFPEEFATFLLGKPELRAAFMANHPELLDYLFWQAKQKDIRAGHFDDVFPYPPDLRFSNRYPALAAQ
jgi:isocitrate dehydrogenase kinase/phosphatase